MKEKAQWALSGFAFLLACSALSFVLWKSFRERPIPSSEDLEEERARLRRMIEDLEQHWESQYDKFVQLEQRLRGRERAAKRWNKEENPDPEDPVALGPQEASPAEIMRAARARGMV
jgi:hypothetical protein